MFKVDTTDHTDLTLDSKLEVMDQGQFYYMQEALNNIKELNIQNFNYIVFEEDLDNMYKSEFEEFYRTQIIPTFEYLKQYIDIDTEIVHDEPYRIKHIFVKNIVRFIMNTLPYIYMKEFLETKDVEGMHDAFDEFNDDIKINIITQINKSHEQFENFNSMMTDIGGGITNDKKRGKFNGMLGLLDSSINNKSKLLDYYVSVIQNSGSDNLKELFKTYVRNDLDNLI